MSIGSITPPPPIHIPPKPFSYGTYEKKLLATGLSIPLDQTTLIELKESAFNYKKILFSISGRENPIASFVPVFNEIKYELDGYPMGIPKDELLEQFCAVGFEQMTGTSATDYLLQILTIEIFIDLMHTNKIIFKPNYSKQFVISQNGITVKSGAPITTLYGDL